MSPGRCLVAGVGRSTGSGIAGVYPGKVGPARGVAPLAASKGVGAVELRSAQCLRALMDQESVSLGMLAEAVGVHRSFISHLVSGRSPGCLPERAARIAQVLDVPVDLLFRESGDARPRRPGVQAQLDAVLTGRRSTLARAGAAPPRPRAH